MPEDPEGAVFAYNHADWYVAEVMARAACFSGIGNGAIGGLSLIPKRQELVCAPADGAQETIPEDYMKAFQDAAGRYELGRERRLGAGRGRPDRVELRQGHERRATSPRRGPLGITEDNWKRYAVDGDGDGKVKHSEPGRLRGDPRPDDLGRAATCAPASSSTTMPSGTSTRSSATPRRWPAAAR